MRPNSVLVPSIPLSRGWRGLFLGVLLGMGASARAVQISWVPPVPCAQDEIRIIMEYAPSGGVLHWGVNGRGSAWQAAVPAHRPAGSEQRDVATRTPWVGPDENGRCEVVLGPFRDPAQIVHSIHFAIQWDDGTWDNHGGQDYHIELCSRRVTFEPPTPTYRDPLLVRVQDAGEGAVLHWGVNEIRPGRWDLVHEVYRPDGTEPRGRGNAVETPLPPANAEGVSELVLGPFDRPEQVVTSLHAVVRWDGAWDTDRGRNFNQSIHAVGEGDAYLALSGLAPGGTVWEDFVLTVQQDAAAAERRPVELWLNEEPFQEIPAHVATVTVPVQSLPYGEHRLVARSEVDGRVERAHLDFLYYPRVEERRAPVGTRRGAHVARTGMTRFALHAPGKYAVALVGDFNDGAPEAHPMWRSPDGVWWTELDLPPGRYRYQYLVDGHRRIADPYAREVEWKDESGRSSWRPYHAHAVLTVGAEPYAWTAREYRRPALDDLIIYELYIEDFSPGEGFQGVIDRLDYIASLGVNAIEMLPVNEFGTTHSWGYNPAFHFAPESDYGTPDDLKRLVDEAHRRGLAVIFDAVLNHLDSNSPLYQLYGDDYDASPYFHRFEGDNWGFPDLDQESEAFQQYAADVVEFWLREYRFDGYRYDATRWVGWSGERDWGAGWFAYAGKREDPDSYHIAEHIPPDPQLMIQTPMDSNWDSDYRWRMRDMLVQGRLDAGAFAQIMDPARSGYARAADRMAYLESHDEERIMRDLRNAGFDREEAVRRVQLGHALLLTSPGILMLYAGEEWGEATAKVVGLNPLHWGNLDDPLYASIRENLVNLTALRRTHPALPGGELRLHHLDEGAGVAVYSRAADEGEVLVGANFSREPRTVALPVHRGLEWRQVSGPAAADAAVTGAARLPPGTALVLSGVKTDG